LKSQISTKFTIGLGGLNSREVASFFENIQTSNNKKGGFKPKTDEKQIFDARSSMNRQLESFPSFAC